MPYLWHRCLIISCSPTEYEATQLKDIQCWTKGLPQAAWHLSSILNYPVLFASSRLWLSTGHLTLTRTSIHHVRALPTFRLRVRGRHYRTFRASLSTALWPLLLAMSCNSTSRVRIKGTKNVLVIAPTLVHKNISCLLSKSPRLKFRWDKYFILSKLSHWSAVASTWDWA